MTGWFFLSRIGPCGAATGLDIGLGNMSLKFISLTFFSMFPYALSMSPGLAYNLYQRYRYAPVPFVNLG